MVETTPKRRQEESMTKTRIGEKYGKWTVITKICINRITEYYCECECGHLKFVPSNQLITGRSTQCKECYNKEFGVAASKMVKAVWKHYKKTGKPSASKIFKKALRK